jgi:hypothetical protein
VTFGAPEKRKRKAGMVAYFCAKLVGFGGTDPASWIAWNRMYTRVGSHWGLESVKCDDRVNQTMWTD